MTKCILHLVYTGHFNIDAKLHIYRDFFQSSRREGDKDAYYISSDHVDVKDQCFCDPLVYTADVSSRDAHLTMHDNDNNMGSL